MLPKVTPEIIEDATLKIKEALASVPVSTQGMKLIEGEQLYWIYLLLLPDDKERRRIKNLGVKVKKALVEKAGVRKDNVGYEGKMGDNGEYLWYIILPNAPEEIYEAIHEEASRRAEEDENKNPGMGIPIPNKVNRKAEYAFMTLKKAYYDLIIQGKKKVEYRNLNQYYCDKLLPDGEPVKYIKFQDGYSAPNGVKPRQMMVEVKKIMYCDEFGVCEFDAIKNGKVAFYKDLPPNFAPALYAIHLGEVKEAK